MSSIAEILHSEYGSITTVTAPTVEPVTLAELKLWCKVDDNDDNDLMSSVEIAARQYCEDMTRRQFCTATYDWRLTTFPASASEWLEIPKPPLQSITSISYVDTAGATQTWTSTLYQADIYDTPGRVRPAYGQTWPSTRDQLNAVTVRFVAGYGAAATVPDSIKTAIKLLAEHLYRERSPVIIGSISKQLEFSLESLLWQNRATVAV